MAADTTAISSSRNAELVRAMVNCYCAMDADGLSPLLDHDAKHTAPGSDFGADLIGSSKIIDYFRNNVFPSFDAVRFDIVHLYEDPVQSVVVVEWRSHLNPKTGKDYSNTGVFVVEIRQGKIYWVREYFDTQKAHQHV
jgi:ketosteroid isomerase-like protein